jgi:hypothetical protein
LTLSTRFSHRIDDNDFEVNPFTLSFKIFHLLEELEKKLYRCNEQLQKISSFNTRFSHITQCQIKTIKTTRLSIKVKKEIVKICYTIFKKINKKLILKNMKTDYLII